MTNATEPEDLLQKLLEFAAPQFYTPAQAAKRLGKTTNWVEEAIVDGRIPHTRIGKSPRLTPAHLRQIAAAGEVPVSYRRAA